MSHIPFLDATTIRSRLRPRAAVDALAAALKCGLEPATAVPRAFVPFTNGDLLLMPAEFGEAAGVKVVSVSPHNGERDLPRIQGVYVLFDAETLAPRALLDGVELTALRTPAVSLLAVRDRLRRSSEALDIVVIGTGIQGIRHADTAIDVLQGSRRVASVTYVSRRPRSVDVPRLENSEVRVVQIGSAESDAAVAEADLVVCATSAREPLFDGALVRDTAAVVAVGSHDKDRRELDEHLMARSSVVVEDVATAMREAGDVVQAVQSGHLTVDELIPLKSALLNPRLVHGQRPLVFKSSGMAWQDVVVAAAVMRG